MQGGLSSGTSPSSSVQTLVTSHSSSVQTLHSDPRGLIPPFLVNQMLSKACDQIADMRKYMERVHTSLPDPGRFPACIFKDNGGRGSVDVSVANPAGGASPPPASTPAHGRGATGPKLTVV